MSFLCDKCHTAACLHFSMFRGPCENCGEVAVCVDCPVDQPVRKVNRPGWIGVDLDGTLAHYDGFKGFEHIGEPIPAMLERVKRWLAEGRDVRIFTARVDGGAVAMAAGDAAGAQFRDVERARRIIGAWCLEHIGAALVITNVKDYAMDELWDDRAVAVEPNTGRALNPSRRGLE